MIWYNDYIFIHLVIIFSMNYKSSNDKNNNKADKTMDEEPENSNDSMKPPPTTSSGTTHTRNDIKLKSPTNEDDYIKSEKVHMYHGRHTHYYRDEPKHEMLLTFQVNIKN